MRTTKAATTAMMTMTKTAMRTAMKKANDLAKSELKRSAFANNESGKSKLSDVQTSSGMFIAKGKQMRLSFEWINRLSVEWIAAALCCLTY
ncbi:hypothetical protein RHMOL_Rhmol09G0080300 [Rhododendron molle]|uniref:Uncharacterized protein n=2 Tax=Rhododendron molle TaxID=49168 RepID=A0ACC0MC61_RHOML|nr:hypothetical protein RHMOL_Rhmol09G0080300 [Rhododendron molle]KAI8538157.1 hypothetical protein RHMOL_Rhmol09G0080300 [Rhododendron molle]